MYNIWKVIKLVFLYVKWFHWIMNEYAGLVVNED
jgi:hypothetical protein